jgi:hypothetical protein
MQVSTLLGMSEDQQCFEWRATGRLSRGWAAEIYASAITIQIDSLGVSSQDTHSTHARNTLPAFGQ